MRDASQATGHARRAGPGTRTTAEPDRTAPVLVGMAMPRDKRFRRELHQVEHRALAKQRLGPHPLRESEAVQISQRGELGLHWREYPSPARERLDPSDQAL